MYLVELDASDGLVKVGTLNDGLRAIKEFREVLNDPDLGRECLTAIALVVDWLSPRRYYSEEDRPLKAMYDVTGDRRAFVWAQEKIQAALIKYAELQYNPDLMEKRNLDEMRIKKLQEIREEGDSDKQADLFKQLNVIKDLIKAWERDNLEKDLFADAPTEGGYTLTRLEEKLRDSRSFYNK